MVFSPAKTLWGGLIVGVVGAHWAVHGDLLEKVAGNHEKVGVFSSDPPFFRRHFASASRWMGDVASFSVVAVSTAGTGRGCCRTDCCAVPAARWQWWCRR